MVWGCMTARGVGVLRLCEGNLDSKGYIDIIANSVVPSGRALTGCNQYYFQQDGAPCHTSRLTMSWIEEQNLNLLPWAPQSPDLNPIEHLWNLIKAKLSNKRPSSREELWKLVQSEWYSVSPEDCRKRVHNMNKRVMQVLKANGGNTSY